MAKKLSESTTIVINLNIKSFLIVIGALASAYAAGFYFLNDKMSSVNNSLNQMKKEDIEVLKMDNSKINGQLKILIERDLKK